MVYQKAVVGQDPPFKYNWPGIGEARGRAGVPLTGVGRVSAGRRLKASWGASGAEPPCLPLSLPAHGAPTPALAVATLAMVMINMLPRRDLADEGREEGEEVR